MKIGLKEDGGGMRNRSADRYHTLTEPSELLRLNKCGPLDEVGSQLFPSLTPPSALTFQGTSVYTVKINVQLLRDLVRGTSTGPTGDSKGHAVNVGVFLWVPLARKREI